MRRAIPMSKKTKDRVERELALARRNFDRVLLGGTLITEWDSYSNTKSKQQYWLRLRRELMARGELEWEGITTRVEVHQTDSRMTRLIVEEREDPYFVEEDLMAGVTFYEKGELERERERTNAASSCLPKEGSGEDRPPYTIASPPQSQPSPSSIPSTPPKGFFTPTGRVLREEDLGPSDPSTWPAAGGGKG